MLSRSTWRPRQFVQDEGGAVTIEAVLWIPFFFSILMLITDASLAFYSKAEAMRVIEAGNRAFAINEDATTAATATWVQNQFTGLAKGATATTEVNATSDTVQTTLRYPVSDVVLFNTLGIMTGRQITVRAMRHAERDIEE